MYKRQDNVRLVTLGNGFKITQEFLLRAVLESTKPPEKPVAEDVEVVSDEEMKSKIREP